MYRIDQFKPALYVLLLFGVTGYALAALSPGIWVLGCGGILLNWWLTARGAFVPLPRLLANTITLISMAYVARQMAISGSTPVLVIGQFLVLLQLVKLWEQRGNRDYAQLLVLGLLLMVAASINTASLLFGVLLVVYLFLSLYCCLLFHLKVESDLAKAAFALPEEKLNPLTLRQDERYLSGSMRKLTGFVSLVAVAMAVLVFIFFPRGAGAGFLGPMQLRPEQALTGFNEQVGFQQVARITQNTEEVAYVHLWKNDKEIKNQELLLRGSTLDVYTGNPTRGPAWQWTRPASYDEKMADVERNRTLKIDDAPPRADRWRQLVSLKPTGTFALFSLGGPLEITPHSDMRIRYDLSTGVLHNAELLNRQIEYEVTSTVATRPPTERQLQEIAQRAQRRPPIDPRITAYAQRPDVSGSNDKGPLAAQRGKETLDDLDEQIASNIEHHLRTTFSYTLDLTDARRIRGEDPLVAFLYDLKRGHCEYFAGAMALMCQSLGMPARMVIGFKCDEYNNWGYYIVRQSHAHAWVEVLTRKGWLTFDPTSGQPADVAARRVTAWMKVKHFFSFLEYTYANSVIAYDNEHRENLIQNVENRMTNAAINSSGSMQSLRKWFDSTMFWKISSNAIGGFVALMVLAILGVVLRYLWERWMLRRRAARIGLEALPEADQIRLVRQLGFYDDLLILLGRHQIVRPPHQTPMEFTNSLMFLPSDVYKQVRRLTAVYYRVRYGRARLSPTQQRRLSTAIARLGDDLSSAPPAGA